MDYTTHSLQQRPELIEHIPSLSAKIWPRFMYGDAIADQYHDKLRTMFLDYQLAVCDAQDRLVALGESIPLFWDGTTQGLPEGWDGALVQSFNGYKQGLVPNTLCALSVTIDPEFQGQGLSAALICAMKTTAREHHLTSLIAPVRPNFKHRYPLMAMDAYMAWLRDDGLPMDPWLRVHTRLGAKVLRIAPASMCIKGTVHEWEGWIGFPLHVSGSYIVPGALAPVQIEREQDCGTYIEPNVWMHHTVEPSAE